VKGNIEFLAAQQQTNPLVQFLPLVVIVAAFYFFLIRPQTKRRREQAQMQGAVRPGTRVLTTSGMQGTVVTVDDDGMVLEIAPGVQVRFVKQAVMQVLTDDADEAPAGDGVAAVEDGVASGEPVRAEEATDLTKDATSDDAKAAEEAKGSTGSDKKTPGKPSA
jgi:preprotein translocase subunit YajC